jgi:hypothetical protein
MKMGRILLFGTLAISLVLPVAAAEPIGGVFALQGRSARTSAYLVASPLGSDLLARRLVTWMTQIGSSTAIRTYRVDMTKYLHMIIVSDDFRTFLHVHPKLGADGHFTLDETFPLPARYHVYIDGEPDDAGQQVFRFDIDLGGRAAASRDLSERGTTRTVGPYEVRISSDALLAAGESRLAVHITKDGKPAGDLHPYLGALAHAVFLNSSDLSYAHAHPVPLGAGAGVSPAVQLPSSATSSPNMALHVSLREPGIYKLWLQFKGGDQLYVAPFVVTVS